jgi:AcrR family transcriptional regulator
VQGPGGGRQWARADATRQALLTAARAVFSSQGYADAGIAEIVTRSGISVGSLYHHYGGKAGLYLALWEEHTAAQERRRRTGPDPALHRGRPGVPGGVLGEPRHRAAVP